MNLALLGPSGVGQGTHAVELATRYQLRHPATVRARLATFHRQTEPLITYYRQQGLLQEISGEGAVAQITAQGLATIQRLAGTAEVMIVASTR
jgi:adenylate kinase family enzyme